MTDFFNAYPWLLITIEAALPLALIAYIIWYMRRPPRKRD
jgi:hypothetical protein